MLVVEFVAGSRLEREVPQISHLPVYRNGPPGTFVCFADGRRIPLPTDQIVAAQESPARVSFGGMELEGADGELLVFRRVRDLLPEEQLSPERRNKMTLLPDMVAAIFADDRLVWPIPN
jgi:hypothetical protein